MKTHYLIWCHLVILIGVSYSAVNWPVFFENMGNVNSIHNKWEITFIYKSRFAEMENRISNLTLTMNNLKLDKVWEKDAKNNTERVFSEKDDLIQMSQKLIRKIRLFGTYGPKQKSRIKRQAVPEFRGILESMFGVVSQQKMSEIQHELHQLKEKQTNEFRDLELKQNKISSTTKRELQNTMTMVKKVEAMTGLLENKLTVMEKNNPTRNIIKETIHKALETIKEELEEINIYLESVDSILECLGSGRLSRLVVPGHLLRKKLAKVEKSIPSHFSLLYPSEESLWPYYTVIPCRMFMSDDYEEIIAHVSVPLIDSQHIFNLHKIHNLPMKIRDGYSVTADIKTEYLLTDKSGDYYMELGKEDFQDCQVYSREEQIFFCGFGPLLQTSKSASCVIQLFNIEGEGELCQSKLSHGLMQPFTRLYNGSWVFAAINQEIPVTMQCQNTSMKMALFGFGVLNLMDGCTLTSEQFLYPHTFSGHFEVNLSDDDGEESIEEETDPDFSEDPDISEDSEDSEETDSKPYVLDKQSTNSEKIVKPKKNVSKNNNNNDIILKKDFKISVSNPEESSGDKIIISQTNGTDSTVQKVINVLTPAEFEDTTIHYNVLVKLKDQIMKGDNWIDKYNKSKRIIL